jgi:opacity protein-like surface antigen
MDRPRARLLKTCVLALAAACGLRALDAHAQVATPPPGKAVVVLYRADKQPVAGKVPVIANADRLGTMGNGEYVNAIVNPGRTFLRAGDRILTTLALQTSADQTYFVLIEAVPGFTPLRVEMRQMTEGAARRAIAQSSPIGTAPAVAAVPAPRAPAAAVVPPAAAVIAPRVPATAQPAPPRAAAAPAPRAAPAKPAPARKAPVEEEEDQWQFAGIVKAGSFKLASASQTIGGLDSTYDKSSKPAAGVELEFRHHSGFALGGEVFYYKNDLTANGPGLQGNQSVVAAMLNGKYYFAVTDWLHPFVSAGVDYSNAAFGGDLSGKASGAAFQGMAGVDLRFSHVGLYVEYKYLNTSPSDGTNKVKAGGSGVLAGLSIAF